MDDDPSTAFIGVAKVPPRDLAAFVAAEGTVHGKTATVPATVSVPVLGSTNFRVYLVDEQGTWKVCGLGPG